MIRQLVIAGVGSIMLAGLPAFAQDVPDVPELEGAPGPLRIPQAPKPAAKPVVKPPAAKPVVKAKPATPATKVADTSASKAEQARLDREADELRLERARLDKLAAELKSRQMLLDARAADIAAKEKGVATRESELAAEKEQLARDTEDVARQLAAAARTEQAKPAAAPTPSPAVARRIEPRDRAFGYEGLDHEVALDACIDASGEAARVQSFYSARYDVQPRFYEGRYLQVRGLMRIEDRRGYRVLDTLCEVDADGDVQRFVFLR